MASCRAGLGFGQVLRGVPFVFWWLWRILGVFGRILGRFCAYLESFLPSNRCRRLYAHSYVHCRPVPTHIGWSLCADFDLFRILADFPLISLIPLLPLAPRASGIAVYDSKIIVGRYRRIRHSLNSQFLLPLVRLCHLPTYSFISRHLHRQADRTRLPLPPPPNP